MQKTHGPKELTERGRASLYRLLIKPREWYRIATLPTLKQPLHEGPPGASSLGAAP